MGLCINIAVVICNLPTPVLNTKYQIPSKSYHTTEVK